MWRACILACINTYIQLINTVRVEIFTRRKFLPIFAICSHWWNFYHANFLSGINDYIEDMATFTAWAKIYSTDYFCNTKVVGLGEIFVKRKFSRTHMYTVSSECNIYNQYWKCLYTSSICPMVTSSRACRKLSVLSGPWGRFSTSSFRVLTPKKARSCKGEQYHKLS